MKEKLSVTVDAALLHFLDRLRGPSRSAKLERVLRSFQKVWEDRELRRALAKNRMGEDEQNESEAWVRTMEHDQWNESAEATSGRSNSWRTRNRGRA